MSQLNVDTIKKADGTGNLSVPAETGTVVTTASPSLGRRNLIINGAMQVAQRGTSSTTNGIHTVDRWDASTASAATTKSQATLSTSDEPFQYGFRKYLRQEVTSTSSATNAFSETRQFIEAQNLAGSGWDYTSSSSYITVSAWVRSSLAGTYYLHLTTRDGTAKQYITPFTLAADTWTKITKTISGESGLSVDNDNGQGLIVAFIPYYGTDYTDNSVVTNSWGVRQGNNYMPDFLQNWANTSGATFDVTGVQLEVGSVATPFEHRSYGEELALCWRYFLNAVDSDTGSGANTPAFMSAAYDGNSVYSAYMFPVEMRGNPSTTFSDASDFSIRHSSNVTATNTATQGTASRRSAGLNWAGSVSSGSAGWVRVNGGTNAYIYFDAEL